MTSHLVLLAALALAPAPVPAPAAAPAPTPTPRPTVILLPLDGDEALDDLTRATLQEALLQGLSREAWIVRDGSQRADLRGCAQPACLAPAVVEFAVRVRTVVTDRDYVTRVELLDGRTAQVLAASDDLCELCGAAELREQTANQAALLAASVAARVVAPPELIITSEPAGALVFVDDTLVGRTPVRRVVGDGARDVRVELADHIPERRRVVATAGVRDTIRFTLAPTPAHARSHALGLALVISGVAAALAGGALLVLDGREVRYRCDGALIDAAGTCRYIYKTDIGGAALLSAGALAIGGGAVLLRRTGRRPVRAALAPNGVRLHF